MRIFNVASDEEIKSGGTTDIYFVRTKKVLRAKGLEKAKVVAEVTINGLPENWPWGVLCGLDELAKLFEGCPVNVYAMPEGTIFRTQDHYGNKIPVAAIDGPYVEFCELETPLLGFICQASGIATMAARLRKLAWNKLLVAFGIRRAHPAISVMIDRASYIGGFDGVSSLSGAKKIGKEPIGTMPHALMVIFGDQVKAWKAFDEVIPLDVNRVALVDTYFDEKAESIMASDALGKNLWGVRLDTPGSRRGNFAEIIREVRWELDIRGHKHVKIIVSGGINDKSIAGLVKAGVDGFGIGTALSNAPTIDFAMDIVEMNGKPVAKRGKLGGRKQVWRCQRCLADVVLPAKTPAPKCPACGGKTSALLVPLIKGGKIASRPASVDKIRAYVLAQLKKIPAVN
ncbi:MAG: nicotinate phosphoribosyltransferase [Methanobacteriota archaeon]